MGDLHQVEAVEASRAATGADAGADGNGVLGVVTLAAGVEGLVIIKGPTTDHALGHGVGQQDLLAIGEADTTGSDDVAVLGPRGNHRSRAGENESSRGGKTSKRVVSQDCGEGRADALEHCALSSMQKESAAETRAGSPAVVHCSGGSAVLDEPAHAPQKRPTRLHTTANGKAGAVERTPITLQRPAS